MDKRARHPSDNDAYTKMSPVETVKACVDAWKRLGLDEMRKFDPDYDVEDDKAKAAMAEKNGMDPHNIIPLMEVGDAFWSAEQSAWFVKCRAYQTKKWNIASGRKTIPWAGGASGRRDLTESPGR